MIDFAKIRKQPTGWTITRELIANALQLLLMSYGLKCLVTQSGKMLLSVRGAVYSTLHLTLVSGTAAVMAGLAYFGFGLFLYLSDGNPPEERRGWLWRIGRATLRWGGLVFAVYGYLHADNLVAGRRLDFTGVSPVFLIKIVSFFVGFFALLAFLFAMFQREQVKRELGSRGCTPLHISWRPAAYWVFWYWWAWTFPTGFHVVYADPEGFVHKGYCYVYRSFRNNPQWGNRRVRWLTDTIVRPGLATQVTVDDEIIRRKFKDWDAGAEADNLLKNQDETSE